MIKKGRMNENGEDNSQKTANKYTTKDERRKKRIRRKEKKDEENEEEESCEDGTIKMISETERKRMQGGESGGEQE